MYGSARRTARFVPRTKRDLRGTDLERPPEIIARNHRLPLTPPGLRRERRADGTPPRTESEPRTVATIAPRPLLPSARAPDRRRHPVVMPWLPCMLILFLLVLSRAADLTTQAAVSVAIHRNPQCPRRERQVAPWGNKPVACELCPCAGTQHAAAVGSRNHECDARPGRALYTWQADRCGKTASRESWILWSPIAMYITSIRVLIKSTVGRIQQLTSRVARRVMQGGHDVPIRKLSDAIQINRKL
jgi:hypothetical protein